MSFYTDSRPGIFPGQTNNVTNGLCERICIQATKVFDACMNQSQIENYSLTLTDFNPANPTTPLNFVSGNSLGGTTTISNLVITRFDDRPNFARVQATINIPVTVTYTDANNTPGTATGTISLNQDVILYVPQPSLTPIDVIAFGSAVIAEGSYNPTTGGFTISACVTTILKVVAVVDVLVPSYGYCPIPPCTPFTGDDICPGVFELPLYPTAVSPQSTTNR
ncbi:MAG: hypothetical protein E7374_03450 [Clostridiales bacterium]|nr:hypothetical protein [Clostridiales bacterium]